MTLQTYWRKRDFKATPEPRGKEAKSKGTLSFFIQRHHARRLHYDFRLELNGTLKSWAVPKGPSLNPSDKRLAVHVEDHPLDYGPFEGEIPAHQYGAGKVVLWDKGIWIPIGNPDEGYAKGHLKFTLDGHKLHGNWALVRMGKSDEDTSEKENWLLIKEKDEEAKSGDEANITELRPESVAKAKVRTSAKEGLTAKTSIKAKAGHDKLKAAANTLAAAMPEIMAPQLATLVDKAPDDDRWLSEIKYDGYRALSRIDHSKIVIYTRAGNDWTTKWPAIAKGLSELAVDQAWLDGEVVALLEDGSSSFQALQNFDSDVKSARKNNARLVYYVFDLLYLNGLDISELPLVDRKLLLKELLSTLEADSPIIFSDHIAGNAPAVFKGACKQGLEGIIVKQADAAYFHGRSLSWQKVKCLQEQEFVIGGYTDPEGSRTGFGAIVLGVYDDTGKFIYSGRVGTGFDNKTINELAKKFRALTVSKTPFDQPPTGKDAHGVHWVKPALVAKVKFMQWTDAAVIRHASFIALREDKVPKEIRRERAVNEPSVDTGDKEKSAPPNKSASAKPLKPHAGNNEPVIAGVHLTHPDKVLFSARQETKLDLAHYYQAIEEWIMPHLVDRPLALVRCPQGSEKECFFQKHFNESSSELVQQVTIPGNGIYMMANNLAALMGLVQMGVLELHTWGSRQSHLNQPDRITMDLDPDPSLPWIKVVEGAQLVKFLLENIGLASFVKTTGGKGLHVVVPIRPELDFVEIKAFAKSIAEHLAKTLPDHFVANMSKKKRTGKIFLDYLRNGVEATAIAGYSTRARADAPISTPVAWDELSEDLHADSFNLGNILERLDKLKKDPWADYPKTKQRVTATMIRTFAI
jgi:bifunctional non-homologous end joining protein LigD